MFDEFSDLQIGGFDGGAPACQAFEHASTWQADAFFDEPVVSVDPVAASYDPGSLDPAAIAIRLQREQSEQLQADWTGDRGCADEVPPVFPNARWVPEYEDEDESQPAPNAEGVVDADEAEFNLSNKHSSLLAGELKFEGQLQDDGWRKPSPAEWAAMPFASRVRYLAFAARP